MKNVAIKILYKPISYDFAPNTSAENLKSLDKV